MCIEVSGEQDRVVIDVGDDGPGIPAAERAHIFDRFTRGGRDLGFGHHFGQQRLDREPLAIQRNRAGFDTGQVQQFG
ncbi:ATP-binding protein, partial [Nocardia cyriacigeorgica]|uniref:ATP-binding protein n=1 Tax=Nocardia cyriacigeorgica TaxID=135487 RepID=UPI002812539C